MTSASPTINRRIVRDIEGLIRSGTWPPGYRIPVEFELAQQYGCARATVSKAIGELVGSGLIERRKKAGSFVAAPVVHAGLLGIPDIRHVVTERGEPYAFKLLRSRQGRASPAWRDLAKVDIERVLVLDGLHYAADRPLAYERREISLAAVPEAATTDFSREAPGHWLLGHVPWTEGRHKVRAINPDAQAARHLDVSTGQACLQIERWTWRVAQPITFVRQMFVGSLFDLEGELARPAARN